MRAAAETTTEDAHDSRAAVLERATPVALPVLAAALFAAASFPIIANALRLPTLWGNLAASVVTIGVVVMWWGGVRAAQVGLIFRDVPGGIAITFAVWGVVQFVGLAQHGASLHEHWSPPGNYGFLFGRLAEQMLGNAPYEELVFRAFLLPQAYLIARKRRRSALTAVVVAIVVSQLVFTAIHLPHRLGRGVVGAELAANLARVFVSGVILAILYLSTNNLFVAIGLHALGNHPLQLTQVAKGDAKAMIGVCAVVISIVAFMMRRRQARRRE